jgi:heme/copper-type cytochrome/quinol oxidase subunit 2
MIRQTKATLAAWSVAALLVVGLLLFGCGRKTGHTRAGHTDGSTVNHGADESVASGTGGEHAHSHGAEAGEHHMTDTQQDMTPSGMLSDGVRTVQVKAREFEFDPAKIIVNEGEKVRLQVTSEDAMHGIGIADFDIDKKLPPGEMVTVVFTADKPGAHHFHCTVYCGKGHGDMHGELVVIKSEE